MKSVWHIAKKGEFQTCSKGFQMRSMGPQEDSGGRLMLNEVYAQVGFNAFSWIYAGLLGMIGLQSF